MEEIQSAIGTQGLLNITITLVCILLSWWALRSFRFDVLIKHPKSPQGIILQIIISVVLGFQLGQFLVLYSNWTSMLKGLF